MTQHDPGRSSRPLLLAVPALIVVLLLAPGAGIVRHVRAHAPMRPHARAGRARAGAGTSVEVDPARCGQGWTATAAGEQDLLLHDGAAGPVDVLLLDDAGRAHLEVDAIGSGATRPGTVRLAAGSYHLACLGSDGTATAGPVVTLAGDAGGPTAAGVRPVTSADLIRPVQAYQSWTAHGLTTLQHRVTALADDLAHGTADLGDLRAQWLAASHLYWTLGGAYGAFGRFDAAIDGRPFSGIPPPGGATAHGLPALEAVLWSTPSPSPARLRASAATARRLAATVAALRRHFGTDLALAPLDLGLRTHEILEDLAQDEASTVERPSRSELADLDAGLAGTRAALRPLRPVLRGRDPRLSALDRALGHLQRVLDAHRHGSAADPRWDRLATLSRRDRESLDAALQDALELLSDVAVLTDPVSTFPDAPGGGA